jgi:transcriptional regulator with XRE-family HTH domain
MAKQKRIEDPQNTKENKRMRTKFQPGLTKQPRELVSKLNDEEKLKLTVDRCRGISLEELEERYGIDRNTIHKYLQGNSARIPEIKQELANRCLAVAVRAQKHITDEKLTKSTASQLTTIARESVYTGLMLTGGKMPDNGSVNIAKLVIETANILQQTIKPADKTPETIPQNTKIIDISTDTSK